MMIVREGYPFIVAAIILGLLLWIAGNMYWAITPFILSLYFAYFFRNPKRNIPTDPDVLVSPADGRVMEIISLDNDDFIKEPCTKVVIFLSVFDVHVNRSPMAGEIKIQNYVCGRFIPAYKDSVGVENERHLLGIENDRLRITVTQIAGVLARRIVSWVTVGNKLEKGELYGMIRFGSCTEVVMPKCVEILVQKGQKVIGGETVIGRMKADV